MWKNHQKTVIHCKAKKEVAERCVKDSTGRKEGRKEGRRQGGRGREEKRMERRGGRRGEGRVEMVQKTIQ